MRVHRAFKCISISDSIMTYGLHIWYFGYLIKQFFTIAETQHYYLSVENDKDELRHQGKAYTKAHYRLRKLFREHS